MRISLATFAHDAFTDAGRLNIAGIATQISTPLFPAAPERLFLVLVLDMSPGDAHTTQELVLQWIGPDGVIIAEQLEPLTFGSPGHPILWQERYRLDVTQWIRYYRPGVHVLSILYRDVEQCSLLLLINRDPSLPIDPRALEVQPRGRAH